MCISKGALNFKDNTLTLLRGHWSEKEGEKVREGATKQTLNPIDFLLAIADLWVSKRLTRVL